MTAQVDPALVAALLRELRDVRVDTRDERCQWFRIVRGQAVAIPISVIWRAIYRAAGTARVRVPANPIITQLIGDMQQRVALLTEAEYLGARRAS